ncbi:MAG: energy-coupling factor ABC transporter permease [Methanocorpusculum sp.]|uniref:energy-coupling factor ABC transporter permease n=1 Tax=Methanocorpusculum sp. TaxID=2058474 RepID=UPI00272012AF|nr:energy-coupling factor ABC transporter permease [Methanocorpusculum sp.]MDO9523498.1 energy-coupling factor ABC transporter permease [Methanocorpusculum sp.]
MHFMDGFLPIGWCVFWAVLSAPFLIYGMWKITKMINKDRRILPLMAVCGAFIFVISLVDIPSPTGSCSHPTGTGLSASFFGPAVTSVLGLIILVFQALLLGHGGFTTLGASAFSMAIMGPLAAWLVFTGLRKTRHVSLGPAVFCAAVVANCVTYLVTSLQIALAYPVEGSVLTAFIAAAVVFAVVQIPISIIEGIISGLVATYIARIKPEILKGLGIITDEEIKKILGEKA